MNTLVLFLRTAVSACAGGMVWLLLQNSMGTSVAPVDDLAGVIVPVWVAGLCGGGVAALFSPRQGISVAFTTGVIMALLFLGFRHMYLGLPLGPNTLVTLWPMWFPVAYYLGAYGYLTVLQRIYRS